MRHSVLQTYERFSLACFCPLHAQELVQLLQQFDDVLLVAHLRPGLGLLIVDIGIQFAVDMEHQIADRTVVLPVGFLD